MHHVLTIEIRVLGPESVKTVTVKERKKRAPTPPRQRRQKRRKACKVCGKRYTYRGHYLKHQRKHHGVTA